MTYLWLTGGELPLWALLSSFVVIGKVSAETYLACSSEYQDMSLKKKITQVVSFLPMFSLTALFRNGTSVVFLFLCNSYQPIPMHMALITLFGYRFIGFATMMILCLGLRHIITEDGGDDGGWRGMTELKQLTLSELTTALHDEFTTIAKWGSLSRRDSRRLQMSANTFFFLTRYWHTVVLLLL